MKSATLPLLLLGVLVGCSSPNDSPAGPSDRPDIRPRVDEVVLINYETRQLLATQNALGASGTPVVSYQREQPDAASHRWVLSEEDHESYVYNLYSALPAGEDGTKYATLAGNNTDIDVEVTPNGESTEHRRRRRWILRHVATVDGEDLWRIESQFNGRAMRGQAAAARVVCQDYENDKDMHWIITSPR